MMITVNMIMEKFNPLPADMYSKPTWKSLKRPGKSIQKNWRLKDKKEIRCKNSSTVKFAVKSRIWYYQNKKLLPLEKDQIVKKEEAKIQVLIEEIQA